MIQCIWRMPLGILVGFFGYLMKRKFKSKWGGHVVSKRKEDEFEGVSVTNFRFVEEMLDVPRP